MAIQYTGCKADYEELKEEARKNFYSDLRPAQGKMQG
jgi:hypothetical protein